jgi:WD40 repeat protein
VATASLDRTMRIWDLRKMVDLAPSMIGKHESRLSVSHAAWSAAGHIATTSYDDSIKLYSFGDAPAHWSPGHVLGDDDLKPTVVVPHNNQTGRWVTILKPQWQRKPRDGVHRFAVGNMNRFVDVFAGDGSQVAQLGGDGITAVPAVAQFHPTMEWVAGGTGSGKLCLWI